MQRGDFYKVTIYGNSAPECIVTAHMQLSEDGVLIDGVVLDTEKDKSIFSLCGKLDYSKVKHGDEGILSIQLESEGKFDITDIKTEHYGFVYGVDSTIIIGVIGVVLATFVMIGLLIGYSRMKKQNSEQQVTVDYKAYLIISLIVLGALMWIYRGAQITYPLEWSAFIGDEKEHFFYSDLMINHGLTMQNMSAGGKTGFSTYGYPYPYSNFINYLILNFWGGFSDNIFLVCNLFYFSCYFLNAWSAFFVFNKLKCNRMAAIVLSVIFAFSPYIQQSYYHLYLCAYYVVPMAILLAVRIGRGDYKNGTAAWQEGIFLASVCTMSGIYYAYFSLLMIGVAIIYRMINTREKDFLKMLIYPITMLSILIIQMLPCVLGQFRVGDSKSLVSDREFAESEKYGLKLIQLFLPRADHRISALAGLNEKYQETYWEIGRSFDRPIISTYFVNENTDISMGMVAIIGFLILLVWCFKYKTDTLKKVTALLTLAIVFIAGIGGVGTIVSFCGFTQIRSYCRFSLFILFLSILAIAICWTECEKKVRKPWQYLICGILLLLGLWDQTVDYHIDEQKWELYEELDAQRQLAQYADLQMEQGASVYVLPYRSWPISGDTRLLVLPIEAKGINWGIGGLTGSEEDLWQYEISMLPVGDRIQALKKAGYDGIWMDLKMYGQMENMDVGVKEAQEMMQYLGEPVYDNGGRFFFWKL